MTLALTRTTNPKLKTSWVNHKEPHGSTLDFTGGNLYKIFKTRSSHDVTNVIDDSGDVIPFFLNFQFNSFVKLALGDIDNLTTLDHYIFSDVKESGAETGAILQSTSPIINNDYICYMLV